MAEFSCMALADNRPLANEADKHGEIRQTQALHHLKGSGRSPQGRELGVGVPHGSP
jgi:hypothetical protein